jgi:small subunit ribosomal protein S8e
MALWQGGSRRKSTGGRIRHARGKRRSEIGGERQFTNLGSSKVMARRSRGGDSKSRTLSANICNVYDSDQKKVVQTKILTVKENPSNPNYVQRNIITKSAIVGTELGDVLITSRPGQNGALNGVLVKKQ